MQVQKEEVRQRIVEAATEEFLNKGYANASLRNIAQGASITVGNIYRYYKGKEALYREVTKPAWDGIEVLFQKSPWCSGDITTENLADLAKEIGKVFIENQSQFLILINDTDHENNAKGTIIKLIENQARNNLEQTEPGKEIDTVLLSILSATLTEAMICVFTSFDGDENLLYSRIFKVTHHLFEALK